MCFPVSAFARSYFGCASFAFTEVPGRSSSVPLTATRSPSCKSPKTSIKFPEPKLGWTSTHSVFPSRTRTQNRFSFVRATAEAGTNSVGCARRTGHSTSAYMPGARCPEELVTSSSTGIVRVFTSRESGIRAMVPVNFSPGNAGTVNVTFAPFTVPET